MVSISPVSKIPLTPLVKIKSPLRSFHHFFKVCSRSIYPVWEKLKSLITQPSKESLYLSALLKKPLIDSIDPRLPELMLVIKPYTKEFHLLKAVLKRLDHSQLKTVFEQCFDKMYASKHFDFQKLKKYLDVEEIERASGLQNLKSWLSDMAKCLPESPCLQTQNFFSRLSKTLHVIARFFPNFLDTVLKAFNLIEIGKGPETLWDFSALIGIYFKIFTIPYAVFLLIGCVVTAASQVLLTTAFVLTAGFIGLCLYLKYRPCPNQLPRARNLTEEAQNGSLEPVIGREQEIAALSSYLGKKQNGCFVNLLLVGKSGVGKTELVKGLAAQYKEKKIFLFNASDLAAPFSSSGDRLRLILLDIKGHEKDVLFFIEELGDTIAKKLMTDIAGVLKPLLQRDGVQVIATATPEEYEEIAKDFPLSERFTKIDVAISEKQTLAILQERIASKGKEIFFEENIAEKIIEKTAGKNQPRSAVKLLELAINHVRSFDIQHHLSKETSLSHQKLQERKASYQQLLDAGLDVSAVVSEIKQLDDELQIQKQKDLGLKIQARKLQALLEWRFNIRSNRRDLIAKEKGKKKLAFLHWMLSPWLNKTINEELKALKSIPLVINEALIEQLEKRIL